VPMSMKYIFRSRRMNEMHTIVFDDPRRLSVMQLRCANMAERIEVLLGMETFGTEGTLY